VKDDLAALRSRFDINGDGRLAACQRARSSGIKL
jgi:hypothetical protein